MGGYVASFQRLVVVLVLCFGASVGCSSTVPDVGARDIDSGGPVGEARSLPARLTVWFGTNILDVISETPVTLVRLLPVGLEPDDYKTFFMPLAGTEGALGIAREEELPAPNRGNAVPLEGVVISKETGSFQLLVRTELRDGGLRVRGYWLTYSVGNESAETFIPRSQHVCDAALEQSACQVLEPSK